MNLVLKAMQFAKEAHKGQVRKYTNDHYAIHLGEVAGIVSTVAHNYGDSANVLVATAWLHDSVEDCGVTEEVLKQEFGPEIAYGVMMLSDLEEGNRASRKAQTRARLHAAPGWIQTIKVADLISNTSSIVKHDKNFAVTYLKEKEQLLAVLTKADPNLWQIAKDQIEESWKILKDSK